MQKAGRRWKERKERREKERERTKGEREKGKEREGEREIWKGYVNKRKRDQASRVSFTCTASAKQMTATRFFHKYK